MKQTSTYALCGLFLFFVTACSDDVGIDIYLVRSPDVDENPLDPEVTAEVRMRITGPGMAPIEIISPFEPGGAAHMPDVPAGKDRIITVEGLKSDGLVLSRGRSLPIHIDKNTNKVTLLIARIGRFSYTPDNGLKNGRFGHAVAEAPDGRVFIAGGAAEGTMEAPSSLLSSIEVFNPTDGSVHLMPCENECGALPGVFGNMLPIGGGLVILPGLGDSAVVLGAAYIDPVEETIAPLSMAVAARYRATGVSTDVFAIAVGGLDNNNEVLDLVEIINAAFEVTSLHLDEPRWAMAGAGTTDKGVFFGGFDSDGTVTNDVFIVNPVTRSVDRLTTDLEPRAHVAAVRLSDNRVLLVGGLNANGQSSRSVDIIDPARNTVCNIGLLRTGLRDASVALLPDGRVMVLGGLTGTEPGTAAPSAQILDPRYIDLSDGCGENNGTLFFTDIARSSIARYMSVAHLMKNGNIAVIGGLNASGRAIQQIEIFVPEE